VLEFGVGCSTLVIAEALRRNGTGHLYSVDSDEFWCSLAKQEMPERLRQWCSMTYSPVYRSTLSSRSVLLHRDLPDVVPDLIYLDGPEFPPDIDVAADVLVMEPKLPNDFYIIIDGRWENSKFLTSNLKRAHKFIRNSVRFNAILCGSEIQLLQSEDTNGTRARSAKA